MICTHVTEGARWEPDQECDHPAVDGSDLCARHHHGEYMDELLADATAGR